MKKKPNWEKHKDMWEIEERENRAYVGLYEIVAEQLKEDKRQEAETYQNQLSENVLKPFFYAQEKAKLHHIIKHNTIMNEFVLIYPKDRHVILIPVRVTDEKGIVSVRYFVYLPEEKRMYKWTYFKPYVVANNVPDSHVNETLGQLTRWTFAYSTLDDESFWKQYVLVKELGGYKYLIPTD
ncbi:hypothetical protein KHS38_05310 [Mucilaginibacter sp. Bleaf8]|uniref:hypothetical protein n=1 Tax=Mucilaginibacter sp. Bleaf8 TaxID=2834430 RepID=UPI001BCF793D|nr:hypothetical protein [Mucilaginibacter sp. Bleaf8]MBS7563814.1 hypothetical protein [Mucilaginibacter sp. Bleaf8]